MSPGKDGPAASRERWRREREFLNGNRHALTRRLLTEGTPGHLVAGTPLLALEHWIPRTPVPLDRVRLRWRPDAPPAGLDGTAPALDHLRPRRDDGSPYLRYSDAMGELARPRLFEDRSCYRLLEVAAEPAGPVLTFGPGRYFDVIDVCEAAAHEYAAAAMTGAGEGPGAGTPGGAAALPDGPVTADRTPFRTAVGDPTDLERRAVMTATCTLVIRHDRAAGAAEFVLHWRDPAKVASGGGLYQLMPVGMFQPSHDAPWNTGNDFDLWRAILRELSEELLGGSEEYGSAHRPIDYGAWPLNRALLAARERGALRMYWLGLGMDPLTYVTDLLTVAVLDAELFDGTFARMVAGNAEGHRVGVEDGTGRSLGVPFTAQQVDRLTSAAEPVQPAGAALLHLARRHRDVLLAGGGHDGTD